MAEDVSQFRNAILARLNEEDCRQISPHLRPARLVQGQSLCEAGELLDQMFFVEHGLVSALVMLDDVDVGVGILGKEGLAGSCTLMTADARSYARLVVQIRGEAWRISTTALHRCLGQAPVLRTLIEQQAQIYMAQIIQTAACNSRHGIPQRLARWLLMARERASRNDLPLSHERLSSILGVRRAGVTLGLQALQDAGLIRTSRLKTEIIDQVGLENAACACYGRLKAFTAKIESSGAGS